MQTKLFSLCALLCLCLAGGVRTGPAPGHAALPSAYAPLSPSVQDSTLTHTVQAGEVLIFALPDTVGGLVVDAYAIVHAPALSWLADRSFFWRTNPADAGPHLLLFQSTYKEAPPDTVEVHVTVRAQEQEEGGERREEGF